ncbi:hypothetical protein C8Q72DRAFT_969960 [Fomitopsis betulina]|nr:hypothetical protein C8Q72DRAFT_969960 [Fomitopsis betulina]
MATSREHRLAAVRKPPSPVIMCLLTADPAGVYTSGDDDPRCDRPLAVFSSACLVEMCVTVDLLPPSLLDETKAYTLDVLTPQGGPVSYPPIFSI